MNIPATVFFIDFEWKLKRTHQPSPLRPDKNLHSSNLLIITFASRSGLVFAILRDFGELSAFSSVVQRGLLLEVRFASWEISPCRRTCCWEFERGKYPSFLRRTRVDLFSIACSAEPTSHTNDSSLSAKGLFMVQRRKAHKIKLDISG